MFKKALKFIANLIVADQKRIVIACIAITVLCTYEGSMLTISGGEELVNFTLEELAETLKVEDMTAIYTGFFFIAGIITLIGAWKKKMIINFIGSIANIVILFDLTSYVDSCSESYQGYLGLSSTLLGGIFEPVYGLMMIGHGWGLTLVAIASWIMLIIPIIKIVLVKTGNVVEGLKNNI